jgi:hypothetical protein
LLREMRLRPARELPLLLLVEQRQIEEHLAPRVR